MGELVPTHSLRAIGRMRGGEEAGVARQPLQRHSGGSVLGQFLDREIDIIVAQRGFALARLRHQCESVIAAVEIAQRDSLAFDQFRVDLVLRVEGDGRLEPVQRLGPLSVADMMPAERLRPRGVALKADGGDGLVQPLRRQRMFCVLAGKLADQHRDIERVHLRRLVAPAGFQLFGLGEFAQADQGQRHAFGGLGIVLLGAWPGAGLFEPVKRLGVVLLAVEIPAQRGCAGHGFFRCYDFDEPLQLLVGERCRRLAQKLGHDIGEHGARRRQAVAPVEQELASVLKFAIGAHRHDIAFEHFCRRRQVEFGDRASGRRAGERRHRVKANLEPVGGELPFLAVIVEPGQRLRAGDRALGFHQRFEIGHDFRRQRGERLLVAERVDDHGDEHAAH